MFSWLVINKNEIEQPNEWNELSPPKTTIISQKLMNIGQSIWFCTSSDSGEKGIVRYNTITQKYTAIPYPKHLGNIVGHSCCNYQHLIYIVNGWFGNLIIFNTKTKQFIETIEIPKIGWHNTSIMINQQLHIFNGMENDGKHLVFNPITKKIKIDKDHHKAKKIQNQHLIIHNNQIIRFGGSKYENGWKYLDDFMICDMNINNNNDDYQWSQQSHFALPLPLTSAGYIKWREYLIIVGGFNGNKETDDIYILNRNNSSSTNKWIKSDTKCPSKGRYRAILTENEMVHIIKWGDDFDPYHGVYNGHNPYHGKIHLSSILGDLYNDNDEKEDDEIEYHTLKHPLIILLCIAKYKGVQCNSLSAVATDLKLMKSLWLDTFKYDKNYVSIVTEEVGNEFITASDIEDYLNTIRSKLQLKQYPKADGLIFIYSGHGSSNKQNRNGIVSSDESLILTQLIQDKFSSSNCSFLSKKPKLFYMDCCRGHLDMDEKEVENAKGNDNNVGQRFVSPLSDFYIHMATSQDYVSWTKSEQEGSYMIYALYLCLKQAHEKKKMDKLTIHQYSTQINKKVNQSKKGRQTPEISNKLTYEVHINPQKKTGWF